jgi:hypothetical protein
MDIFKMSKIKIPKILLKNKNTPFYKSALCWNIFDLHILFCIHNWYGLFIFLINILLDKNIFGKIFGLYLVCIQKK